MKRIALLISMLLLAASSALAIDGSVSIEGDVSRTHVAPDINIDVGQVFLKDFRVHSTSEFGKQYDEFTGSPNNYRVGLQYNGVSLKSYKQKLIALLEGLEVRGVDYFLSQSPEVLKELGSCIADKAKGFDVDAVERLKAAGITNPEKL
ncbi:MAG: hypothetical protein ABSB40_14395 [Nitrososphaeria archaeon]